RLLGVDDLARGRRPVIGLAALLDTDQAGVRSRLARDADLRRVAEGFLEAEGEPFRHRVAEHHHVDAGRRVGLARRRGTRGLTLLALFAALLVPLLVIPLLVLLLLLIATAAVFQERETVVEELRRDRLRRAEEADRRRQHL